MIKFIHHHWRRRWERFYHRNRWHLILDIALIVVIIILGISIISLHFYKPNLPWQFWTMSGSTSEIDLNNPPLEITVINPDLTIKSSEGAILKINLKNKGASPMSNIKIKPVIGDQVAQLEELEKIDQTENFKIINQQIIIDRLAAAEEKELSVRLRFSVLDNSQRKIPVQAQVEYLVGRQVIKKTSDLPELQLASELMVRALAYYNSPQGDQLGIGPIPPIVGIPTKYWLFWELSSQGDFQDLVMTAKLPAGVELNGSRSLLAGDFKYNPDSRQLIWTVKEIASQSDSYRLGFEVQLIPTLEQVGKVLPLVTNIKYYAQDALDGQEISGGLKDVDTNLEQDRINKGQGKVIE